LNATPQGGPAYWGDDARVDMMVDIRVDVGAGPVSLFVGQVDHIDVEMQGGLVELTGRDLSARLIETKTQQAFANQTSSEVAQKLADKHMLTADIDATTTLVERYYSQDHTKLTASQFSRTTTEWDLLADLARHEGFDLWVSGTTLHFKKPAGATDTPYTIAWTPTQVTSGFGQMQPNQVIDLRLERALTLAKDVEVEVRSWHTRERRAVKGKVRKVRYTTQADGTKVVKPPAAPTVQDVTKIVRAQGGKSASAVTSSTQKGTSTQRYVFVRPNLSETAALDLAYKLLAEISQHERNVSFRLPGDLKLTARTPLRLQGTGSSWDSGGDSPFYSIDSIDRSVSFEGGLVVSVRGKNHPAESQAIV
ncbi:MAG: hypothetical protein ACRYHQ_15195, partial [Janthinobacterium lividum]